MENIVMESEMTSCENVKPSSPTPPDLQTYKLSMFDQITGAALLPLVLYFADTSTIDHHHLAVSRKTEQLKTSLSRTLTRFYPVAGRVSADYESIYCNDQGVPFFVEYIRGHQLSDLLKPSPDPALWAQLFPCQLGQEWGAGCNVAMIKVSHFECGGVAIVVVFWHKVFDAVTMASFLKYWGATARGSPSPDPSYIIPSLFPPKEELRKSAGPTAEFIKKEKFVSRRYVFDGPAILKLKARSSSNVVVSPSRVEVVTALIWICFRVASLANHEKPVASAIIHSVNLRRRVRPPLPSECFGNMTTSAFASYNSTSYNVGNDELLRHLVREIRGATSKIDDEYVKRMRGDRGDTGLSENMELVWGGYTEGADLLSFTSWCGMEFYGVDFGHGKPVWMTGNHGSLEAGCTRNMVLLMDTKLGDGVEAWVVLKNNYMTVFENVEELRNHAASISLL